MYYSKYIKYKTKYLELKNGISMIGGNISSDQPIDFDKIKVLKKLGAGMLGTTYLVTYNGEKYAQKVQHILSKDKKQDFNNELWRELDLYDYINGLNKKDKLFFTKLHGYKIYDKCEHDQSKERPFKINVDDKKNKFAQKLKKLDESGWCVTYLLDYKGNMTLDNFLEIPGSWEDSESICDCVSFFYSKERYDTSFLFN